jgi:hypothetical protein
VKPVEIARHIDSLAQQLTERTPTEIARREVPKRQVLAEAQTEHEAIRRKMVALQEELDWDCYQAYGLTDQRLTMPWFDAPEISLGGRAFEIVMARQMAAGELQTNWFARHGSKAITEIPSHWSSAYRALVERRIQMIETDPNIALIEKPEYKRRWNTEPWDDQLQRALCSWLLDRLEDRRYWPELALKSCADLAQSVSADEQFMQVAELYRGRVDFDLAALVIELVEAQAAPYLPALRYKPSGMDRRAQWMRTWELQRREDSGEKVEIPVPPKYKLADFIKPNWWKLRGALDVPKERFILYPGCGRRGDGTPVIGWGGWNHLQQAQALATFYREAQLQEGWSREKLAPLLAGLADLIPWLLQWHNEPDPNYDMLSMGDYYRGFLNEQLLSLELSSSDLAKWAPGADSLSAMPASTRSQNAANS